MGQAALVLGGYGFAVYPDSFDPRVEVDTAEEQESLLEDFFLKLGIWHTEPLKYAVSSPTVSSAATSPTSGERE